MPSVGDINFSTTNTSLIDGQNETESSFERYHVALIIIAVLILICNLFAIAIYKGHEKIRRNCSNVLLLSLALSDLIVGVIYLPILIFGESQFSKYYPSEAFIKILRVNYLVGTFSGFSTIFHIIALTIEKYLAVLHPFQRLSVSTRNTYRKILVVVWSLAFAFAFIPLTWMFDDSDRPAWKHKFHIYGVAQVVVFLGLSSVILMYCYVRMFVQISVKLSARTQTGRVQTRARNDRKTVLIFLMFFTFFIVGWAPWFFFNLKHENQELVSLVVKDFLISLRYAGAFLNPLLYTFIKNDFKQAVVSDLRGLCSSCPHPIGFNKLVQTNGTMRSSNNNNRRGTLTTGTGDAVKLRSIESHREPAVQNSSSQAEDTDL